jgi:hypothetical protein
MFAADSVHRQLAYPLLMVMRGPLFCGPMFVSESSMNPRSLFESRWVFRAPVVVGLGLLPVVVAACGGSSPTSPSSTTATSSTGTGVTSYSYTNDVRPILTADCTRCHNASQHEGGYDFTTYPGVLRAVSPGSAQSILVRATSSRGIMYPELSGDRTAKSQVIYDWVVSSNAAQ